MNKLRELWIVGATAYLTKEDAETWKTFSGCKHKVLHVAQIPPEIEGSPTWPHVLAFARRMEAKLAVNRHKGDREGWLKDHPWDLVERMLDETVEVQQCFANTTEGNVVPVKTPEEIANKCADVANFCMMIADKPSSIDKPKVVCLCGSTRFFQHFMDENYRETMAGNIVLSVGVYSQTQERAHCKNAEINPDLKTRLGELHKRKIDMADEVLVINVGGYIGDSTRSEIEYANSKGKPVRYLEPIQ